GLGAAGGGGGRGGAGTGGGAAGGAGTPPPIPRGGRCTAPAGARTADVDAAYAMWKRDLLTAAGTNNHLRVRRPNSTGAVVDSTVSEGIAYGMLLAVYMNDQTTFDQLWLYSQDFRDGNGLMNWYI